DYLDVLDDLPKGINYAGYVGHCALRAYVMGERAFEDEATDDEVATMCRVLDESMRARAIGFSTSRAAGHMTTDDRPGASRLPPWQEVEALVGVLSDLGSGVCEIANDMPPDGPLRQAYFDRLRDLTLTSGRPVTFIVAYLADRAELFGQFQAVLTET